MNMSYPPKFQRFATFITKLQAARNPTSREDAVELMRQVMKAVEDQYGLPNDFDYRMHVFPLDANLGWKDLDKDPCYWDDAISKTHRTEVYNSGRIVITRLKPPSHVVLSKP